MFVKFCCFFGVVIVFNFYLLGDGFVVSFDVFVLILELYRLGDCFFLCFEEFWICWIGVGFDLCFSVMSVNVVIVCGDGG